MRCSTSAVGLGTPELLPAVVAASLHPRTSTGRGISLKLSIVADRRKFLVRFSGTLSPSRRVHHITSCLAHLGRRADIANGDVSFRLFLCTLEDGLFSSAVKHLLSHSILVLQARLKLQALLISFHGGHVFLGGIGFFFSDSAGLSRAGIFTLPLSFLPQY